MGRWRIRDLKTRAGRKCCNSRGGGGRLYSGGITCPRRESQCYDREGSSKNESCQEL